MESGQGGYPTSLFPHFLSALFYSTDCLIKRQKCPKNMYKKSFLSFFCYLMYNLFEILYINMLPEIRAATNDYYNYGLSCRYFLVWCSHCLFCPTNSPKPDVLQVLSLSYQKMSCCIFDIWHTAMSCNLMWGGPSTLSRQRNKNQLRIQLYDTKAHVNAKQC